MDTVYLILFLAVPLVFMLVADFVWMYLMRGFYYKHFGYVFRSDYLGWRYIFTVLRYVIVYGVILFMVVTDRYDLVPNGPAPLWAIIFLAFFFGVAAISGPPDPHRAVSRRRWYLGVASLLRIYKGRVYYPGSAEVIPNIKISSILPDPLYAGCVSVILALALRYIFSLL